MRVIIEGAGEVGSHLAKMLRAENNSVTVIDNDPLRLERLGTYADVEMVEGSPTCFKSLRDAGVGKADLFIAVNPYVSQEVNLMAAVIAKQLGAAKVIARINDEDFFSTDNRQLFKEIGLELMICPEKIAADEIVSSLKHNASADSMEFARGKLQISLFKVTEDSMMIDLSLREFVAKMTPEDLTLFRIIAIARDNTTLMPDLDTRFRFHDTLFVISKQEGAANLMNYFGSTSEGIENAMILGGTQIGELVARGLSDKISGVKLIDKSRDRCIELSEKLPDSVMVINGDGRNSDFLFEEGIRDYDSFIALTGSDETNVLACVTAKKFGVKRTVAEVENIEYIKLAEEMGVDTVINKKLLAAGRIFKYTLSGKARYVKMMTGTNAEVIEYTATPDSAITRGLLKEIKFPKGAIIGGVIRGNESFIAVGNTKIEPYDRVAVFTLPEKVREIDKFFK